MPKREIKLLSYLQQQDSAPFQGGLVRKLFNPASAWPEPGWHRCNIVCKPIWGHRLRGMHKDRIKNAVAWILQVFPNKFNLASSCFKGSVLTACLVSISRHSPVAGLEYFHVLKPQPSSNLFSCEPIHFHTCSDAAGTSTYHQPIRINPVHYNSEPPLVKTQGHFSVDL